MTQQEINKHVGKKIKELRNKHNQTLDGMADVTGLDRSHLNRLELGQQQIKVTEPDIFTQTYMLKGWSYFTEGLRGYHD